MSTTNARIGYGFTFSINSTVIGEVEEIKPGSRTQETIMVKRNDSPDLYGEKILGWKDVKDWELTTTWYQTQYATLQGLMGSFHSCVFTRPDGTNTSTFSAAITELGDEVPLEGKFMQNKFKLTVSGAMS